MLLKHGALVDVPDKKGATALQIAAECGSCKMARLLLAHGANALSRDNTGKTPLEVATAEVAIILRHHLDRHAKPKTKLPPGLNN